MLHFLKDWWKFIQIHQYYGLNFRCLDFQLFSSIVWKCWSDAFRPAKLFFPPQFRTPSTNSFAYSQSETALVNIVLICIQPIRDRTCQYRTLTHWARAQLAALLAYLSEIILSWPHTASWQQAMASWIMYIFQCPTVSLYLFTGRGAHIHMCRSMHML